MDCFLTPKKQFRINDLKQRWNRGENWVGSPKMKEIKQKLCDARPHEDGTGERAQGVEREFADGCWWKKMGVFDCEKKTISQKDVLE